MAEPHLLESQFGDRYKGRYFKVMFFGYQNGYTTEVHVEGLPVRKDKDKLWKSKEEAQLAGEALAHKLIDSLPVE